MTKPLRGVTNEKWSALTTDSIQDLLKPLKVATKPDDGQLYFDFNPSLTFNYQFFLLFSTLQFSFAVLCTTNFLDFDFSEHVMRSFT